MLECASVLGGGKCNPIHSLFSFFFFLFSFERARHAAYITPTRKFAICRHNGTWRTISNLNFEENRSKTNKTTPVWYRPAVQTMPSKWNPYFDYAAIHSVCVGTPSRCEAAMQSIAVFRNRELLGLGHCDCNIRTAAPNLIALLAIPPPP